MKKIKPAYWFLLVVVAVFAWIFIPLISERLSTDRGVEQEDLLARVPLSYIELNGTKRKVPPFAFYNQDSLLITDQDLLGRVYVIDFFFTSCPTICPVMSTNLKTVHDTFGDEPVSIVSISIDPQNDSPEVLKAYAERYGVTDTDWHFLNGPQAEVYQLANEGFNIFAAQLPNAPGGFEHAGLFALVDAQGYLRSRNDDFGNPIIYYRGFIAEDAPVDEFGETSQLIPLIQDIKKLLKENPWNNQ
jgi:protein SCO1/2